MHGKVISATALTFALVSATVAFAQNNKYDLTGGDHMNSYGPVTSQPSPQPGAQQPAQQQPSQRTVSSRTQTPQLQTAPVSNQAQTPQPRSQFDSTGDHMFSYGPASQ
jgi:negative regulator of sigma E activity